MYDYELVARQQWIRQQQRSIVELMDLRDIGLWWLLCSLVAVALVVW